MNNSCVPNDIYLATVRDTEMAVVDKTDFQVVVFLRINRLICGFEQAHVA